MMILHDPFGQEHPYEQGPEERFPRQPLAGQAFTIGIVIRPPQQVQQVLVYSQVADQPPRQQVAQLHPHWQAKLEEGVGAELLERIERQEQDVWQAELIAPPQGQLLRYWIEAGDIASPVYTLIGEDWQIDSRLSFEALQIEGRWEYHFQRTAHPSHSTPPHLPPLLSVEWLTNGQAARRIRLTFRATPHEAFYGFGERFNALNQRGHLLDVRCYEQYKNQGQRTYLPMPFMLSSQGYGVFVQSARWLQFDLTAPDCWVVEADLGSDERLKLIWFSADDPFDIVGQYTLLTGRPALPPEWAFGLWMSGNEWNSQARVLHEVAQTEAHQIPSSVLVIEAWSDETTFYIWNDAQYTPIEGKEAFTLADFTFGGQWPDPKKMIDDLHQKGIRVLLWQVPVFKQISDPHPQHMADKAYFEAQGLGVHNTDGDLYQVRPFWFRGGYLLDVTNPHALDWWLGKRAYLLEEMGIDGFKTDGGEHLWGASLRFADGRQGDELWNSYPQLYSQAYYDFALAKRPQTLTFSRAGFVGSQSAPAHWAGDENSTWEAFRHSILAGLSAGLSGILFWGWDLAGFSGPIPSAELYLRSAAMAAFCPIMQYHAEYNSHRRPVNDRTPWNIQEQSGDERVIPIFRYFVNVRHNLLPYIWQEATYAAQTGQPMLRAAQVLDANASPYQYFFGRDLLVCPIVEEGVLEWSVYLPAGAWHDLWTGHAYQGQQTINVAAPLDRIPVFVRAGASIPVYLREQLGSAVAFSTTANTNLAF